MVKNPFLRKIASIYKLSILTRFIVFFQSIAKFIKDYNKISDFLYGDAFKEMLKKYLNLEVKKDWIGRLYGIINPNLDIDNKFNVNTMIIEIDGENTNNNEQVKNWLFKQLHLIGDLFKINNLYTYIDMTLERVGPINGDNYLVVFDIVSRQQLAKAFKNLLIQTLLYCVIGFGVYLYLTNR